MAKGFLLRLLYATGLLALYHRLRNRDALTVISLHRVLAEDDPRWRTCDPLYTISDRLFEQCLRFLSANYSVVSLEALARAHETGEPLPPRPLLITFDDGWADNHRYALPILRRFGLPAALFVAADAIDRREAFFQERMIAAWRAGRLGEGGLRALWSELPGEGRAPVDPQSELHVRALIGRLQEISTDRRSEILANVAELLADDHRHMLTGQELRELRDGGMAVGTHGKRHEALTSVPDVDSELQESRSLVALALGAAAKEVMSMSFPFSKQNLAVVQRARAAGYHLLFGGGLTMTPLSGVLPDLIARIGITAREVTDANGDLRSYALAAYLFRRPHRALQPA
jgi:peptidoglycan/xylan/chitin deacetylase (PgdA/CDA1 family)